LLIALVAPCFLLGGCSHGDPELRLPADLAAPETDANLRVNADARDGCAFAGTWEFTKPNNPPSVYYYGSGTIVFEVIENKLRGAMIEIAHEMLSTNIPPNFVIIDAVIDPGGRSATGHWEVISRIDGSKVSGSTRYGLSVDGLSYIVDSTDYEGKFGAHSEYGNKVRTGPCGVAVKYVQDAFDSVRSGKPIPKEYFQ